MNLPFDKGATIPSWANQRSLEAPTFGGHLGSSDAQRFLTGTGQLDVQAILGVAREMGKAFSVFKAPAGFTPAGAADYPPLSTEMTKALSAKSLADYFAQTPTSGQAAAVQLKPLEVLPKGPENIKEALAAINAALAERQKTDPDDEETINHLLSVKTNLHRARQLYPRFKDLIDEWPREAKALYQEAKNLSEVAQLLINSPVEQSFGQSIGESFDQSFGQSFDQSFDKSFDKSFGQSFDQSRQGRLSGQSDRQTQEDLSSTKIALTNLTSTLRERLGRHGRLLDSRRKWAADLKLFVQHIESLSAAAGRDDAGRNWPLALSSLNEKLAFFTEKHRELNSATDENILFLTRTLEQLEQSERGLSGYVSDRLLRGELLASNAEVLWNSAIARRQELAECWRLLPAMVGRPTFLGRMFLYSAVSLGRAQTLVEEMRANLARFTGRISSTCEIRNLTKQTISTQKKNYLYPIALNRARRWLASLGNTVLLKTKAQRLETDLAKARETDDALNIVLDDRQSQINRLRELLADKELELQDGGPKAEELRRQISALEAEKIRLSDALSEAKGRLAHIGQQKVQLLKLAQKADDQLESVRLERSGLQEELKTTNIDLSDLRRRHTRLTEYYSRDRKLLRTLKDDYEALQQAHQVSRDEAVKFTQERARLEKEISDNKASITELVDERQKLSQRQLALNSQIEELKMSEASLAVEISGHKEELNQTNKSREQLAGVVASYRAQIDRLTMAYNALKTSWKRRGKLLRDGELEKDSLRVSLDRQKRNLVTMATKRQELLAELAAGKLRLAELEEGQKLLQSELEKARIAQASTAESEKLAAELEQVRREIDQDLKPLIQILALALWRSEAHLKVVKKSVDDSLAKQREESLAREASLRIKAANREIDYIELLSVRENELKQIEQQRDSLTEQLESGRKEDSEKDRQLAKQSWMVQQLSLALTDTNLKKERLRRGLKDFQQRFRRQKQESLSIKTELEELIKNQSQALNDHKAWLAELVPLVGFFLNAGRDFWINPGNEDARDAVLFFMAQENAELSEALEKIKEERQSLAAERQGYLGLHEKMRQHLVELKPLVEFLLRNFIQTTADLARLQLDRDSLAQEVTYLAKMQASEPLSWDAVPAGTVELLSDGNDLSSQLPAQVVKANQEIARLSNENLQLNEAVRQVENLAAGLKAHLSELEHKNQELSQELASKESDIELAKTETQKHAQEKDELRLTLQANLTELTEVKNESSKLISQRDKFRLEAQQKASELQMAQEKLDALLKDPPPDGRLEAAWAALTYISSKDGDTMRQLQSRLDKQARDLEKSFLDLTQRDQEIKRLKERQDNLSLLYWTMLSLASENISSAEVQQTALESEIESLSAVEGGKKVGKLAGKQEGKRAGDLNGEQDDAAVFSDVLEDKDGGDFTEEFLESTEKLASNAVAPDELELFSAAAPFDEATPEEISLEEVSLAEVSLEDFSHPQAGLSKSAENASKTAEIASRTTENASGTAENASGEKNSEGVKSKKDNPQEGEGKLGGSLLAELRKAARRSLFSLVLTGGLVLFLSDQSLANIEPIELGGPDTPMLMSEPATIAANRFSSRYLGRTLDLGFLSYLDRTGDSECFEEKAKEIIAAQAARWGQSPEAWLRLIRLAYTRDETVFLTDLDKADAPLELIRTQLPTLAKALVGSNKFKEYAPVLLSAIDSFKGPEGDYWDRLYQAFAAKLPSKVAALNDFISHLQSRHSKALTEKIEYCGYLRPLADFEKMQPQTAVEFLASHIKTKWSKGLPKRALPRKQSPAALASDLIFSSLIYKLPRTLVASMAHDDFNHFGLWPDPLSLYWAGAALAKQIVDNSFAWKSDLLLCDLDDLTAALRNDRENPCGVNQSHLSLLASLNKFLTPHVSLFAGKTI